MTDNARRKVFILTTLTGAFLLFPNAAFADEGLGFYLFLPTGSPGAMTYYTRGIGFLIIVVIETIVLFRMLKIAPIKAFWVSLLINAVSTILGAISGLLIILPTFLFFLPPVIFCAWWFLMRDSVPRWVHRIIFWTVFGFIVPLAVSGFLLSPFLVNASYKVITGVILFSFLLPGFGTSVFIEGITARQFFRKIDIWKAIVFANIFSYIFLVPATAYFVKLEYFAPHTSWQSRAKGTLRVIGSTELAYKNTNKNKVYGSFRALRKDMYIAYGYTQGNMIENYSMAWNVNNASTVPSEEFPTGIMSTFTIIAFPRDTRPGYLNTFSIDEDQKVRVYNPDNENRFGNVKTWDPIL